MNPPPSVHPCHHLRVPIADDGSDSRCLLATLTVEETFPDIHQQPPHYRAPHLAEIGAMARHLAARPHLIAQHTIAVLPWATPPGPAAFTFPELPPRPIPRPLV